MQVMQMQRGQIMNKTYAEDGRGKKKNAENRSFHIFKLPQETQSLEIIKPMYICIRLCAPCVWCNFKSKLNNHSISQGNSPVGVPAVFRIMCNHYHRLSGIVQFSEKRHYLFAGF